MLTKSVKSVISVVLKHVARAKESVQSVRSVSHITGQSLARAFGGDCKLLETRCNLQSPQKMVSFVDANIEHPTFRPLPHVFSQFDGKGCALAHLAVVHINTSVVIHLNDAFGQ